MTQTWLITGVSSGFGRKLAEKLLARGDRVAGTVRQQASVKELAAKYPEHFWTATLDLRDPEAIVQTVNAAFIAMGQIDRVVSNAGYGVFGAAEETNNSELRDIIDTNLVGSIVLIRSVLPHLRTQGGGRILQVSSEGGQLAYPGFSLYHATKWGIEGFVESVAQEVAPFGIDFIIIEPGPARTNFGQGLVFAQQKPSYVGTPVHQLRQTIESGSWIIKGDPERMVDAMIAVSDQPTAPLRLLLGADAYTAVHDNLMSRLASLEDYRNTSNGADFSKVELAQK